jgi:hypothetical protein
VAHARGSPTASDSCTRASSRIDARVAARRRERVERAGHDERVQLGRRRARAVDQVGEARERPRGDQALGRGVREPRHAVETHAHGRAPSIPRVPPERSTHGGRNVHRRAPDAAAAQVLDVHPRRVHAGVVVQHTHGPLGGMAALQGRALPRELAVAGGVRLAERVRREPRQLAPHAMRVRLADAGARRLGEEPALEEAELLVVARVARSRGGSVSPSASGRPQSAAATRITSSS